MDSEQWKQLDKLLHAALQRAPEERDAFLRQACAGDERLEREARSLLTLEQQAEDFLEKPAMEMAAAQLLAYQHSDQAHEGANWVAGGTISHYQLIERLGMGGR